MKELIAHSNSGLLFAPFLALSRVICCLFVQFSRNRVSRPLVYISTGLIPCQATVHLVHKRWVNPYKSTFISIILLLHRRFLQKKIYQIRVSFLFPSIIPFSLARYTKEKRLPQKDSLAPIISAFNSRFSLRSNPDAACGETKLHREWSSYPSKTSPNGRYQYPGRQSAASHTPTQ